MGGAGVSRELWGRRGVTCWGEGERREGGKAEPRAERCIQALSPPPPPWGNHLLTQVPHRGGELWMEEEGEHRGEDAKHRR